MATQQSQMDTCASYTEKEVEEMPCVNTNKIQSPKPLKEIPPSSMVESNKVESNNVDLSVIKRFPFMKLPLEVRTMIFKDLLIMPGTIRIERAPTNQSSWATYIGMGCIRQRSVRPVFSVSKAFYREAGDIYYRFNTFHFPALDGLFFFEDLSPDHRRAITNIELDYSGKSLIKVLSFLQTFVGLRRLRIEFFPGRHGVPHLGATSCEPRKILGFKALSKIRGLKHLEVAVSFYHVPYYKERCEGHRAAIEKSLSCLLEPHDAARIARLDKKEYPDKFHRSLFGNANVATRMEHKVMGTKPLIT